MEIKRTVRRILYQVKTYKLSEAVRFGINYRKRRSDIAWRLERSSIIQSDLDFVKKHPTTHDFRLRFEFRQNIIKNRK